ncbi:succinate-semialdehyde dehydrogenase (NADP(+)) [Streptomyces californicus]
MAVAPATAADVVTPEVMARPGGVVGSGRTANHTPFTGEKLADLPESTPEDVATAFDRARAAQPAWAAVPRRQRAAVLLRFHDLVLSRRSRSSTSSSWRPARPVCTPTRRCRPSRSPPPLRAQGRRLPQAPPPHRRRPDPHEGHRTAPAAQVIGQIAPWNYPLELSVGDALPAFVSGNAVVMKPDTETALTALWARDLLIEAGLPAEVFQVVLGEGPVVGPEVVSRADYVSFTGSTRTGREVAVGAASRLVGVSLELGGKNAMLVLADADVEKAAAGAVRACFSSAGQLCISIERLYVRESIADDFVQRFAARTPAMQLAAFPRVRGRHGLARR